MTRRLTFFATCAPGLEAVLHREVEALKVGKIERQVGGVRFTGVLTDAWRANLWLRTAIRVLWRLDRFECADDDALYEGVGKVRWSRFVRPDGSLLVDTHSNESALDHTQYIAQRVKDAIVDQLRDEHGERPDVDRDDPDLRVHLHLFRNRATLSVDTSGASLHKRGWRRYQGYAPLAETLAAGLLGVCAWDHRAPLLDPFCGSGTLPIEAAMAAAQVAPGLFRSFGFERWPKHDADGFARMRQEAEAQRRPVSKLTLWGGDRAPEHIAGARENAAAAGVESLVAFERADARDFAPRKGWNAFVTSNLPYGDRIGNRRDNEPTLRRFGERLREFCAGYALGLLCGDASDRRLLGLDDVTSLELMNGGRPVWLCHRGVG